MKVLIVVDKIGSAIWRLAEAVRVNNQHLDIVVFPVHPKRNDMDTIQEAQRLLDWADIIDVHYWKSGEVLRTSFPVEFNSKPRVLFHFNPYDLDKQNWAEIYDRVIVGNEEMHSNLPYSFLINYGVDLKKFSFNQDYTEEKIVQMAVSRIESKKGVLEVALACKDLGYKMLLIGRVSEPNYMHEIMSVGCVQFVENGSDDDLVQSYRKAAVHVCNSVDNFESGTLPILEAMSAGVPVLTRNVGHVPDLYNGENMVVREGTKEDIEEIKSKLKEMMENRAWRIKLRQKAWDTIKNRDDRRMTWEIAKIYYSLWIDKRPLVSVIVPTYDRPESLIDCLVSISQQDFKKIEIVVADSGRTAIEPIITELRKRISIPVKYIRFRAEGYTLAEARNRAVIEAQGEILVFCDDRLAMSPDAISKFAEHSHNKLWEWGVKDNSEKSFVENFSSIRRDNFISGGMFNERMEYYGGMGQEVRTRFEQRQGFVFDINREAHAKSVVRSKSRASRMESIIEAKYLLFKMYG